MTTLATFDVFIRGDTSQFERSMASATKTSRGFISNMTAIASGFVLGNVVMGTFSRGISALQDGLIGYNARMEQAAIGFTTLFGNAQMAASFVEELRVFANKTPFDFPGLQQASTTMMAMGFAAQDIIPTLTAVGDVVAAMGKSGGEASESINRIVYNLGQMKQYGRVTGRDIRDLTMLGVPVVKILAQGFKVSTAEMQNMISKGIVPADKALDILVKGIESGNMGGMMAAQAKTFSGAMSTIKDSMQGVIGTAFRPLFNAIRDVTYAFSQWISSQRAIDFANKVATYVRALVIILQQAAPAVVNFAKGLLNAFQTGVETVRSFFERLQNDVSSVAKNMYTGGWNTIVAYAKGLMDAARVYVAQVVDYITSYVASYLVGQSPPKTGPLSKIYEGGANTIEAWVNGALSADLAPILEIPKKVAAALKTVEAASKFAQSQVQAIGDKIALIDLNSQKLQLSIDRISYSYQTQLSALQKQYDLLLKTYSLTDKKRDLELALKKNQLEQQLNAAKGDWWAQAQIQAQIDQVDQQMEQNRLLEEQEALQAQIAGIPLEEQMQGVAEQMEAALTPLEEQLKALQMQREELSFQQQVWQTIAADVERTAGAMQAAAAAAKAAAGAAGGGRKGGKLAGIGEGGIPKPTENVVPINEKLFGDQKKVEQAAQKMALTFINSFSNTLKTKWPTLLGAVLGGIIGSVIPGVGTAWGAAIGGTLGTIFGDQIAAAVEEGLRNLQRLLSGNFQFQLPSLEQIVTAIATTFQDVFDWILNVGVPGLANALGPMALAFVDWVSEVAVTLFNNLPTIAAAILDFIAQNAPVLLSKLMEWTVSFTQWVLVDLLPKLLSELPKIGAAIVNYLVQLIPIIAQKGAQLALGLLGAIVDNLIKLPGRIWDIVVQGGKKLTEVAGQWLAAGLKLAGDLVSNIMNEISKLPGKIWDTLMAVINNVTKIAPKMASEFGQMAVRVGKSFANGIVDLVQGGINAVIRGINSFKIHFDGLDLGPLGKVAAVHWNGFGLGYVNLPHFEKGAWNLPRDMLANVHEGEGVMPRSVMDRLNKVLDAGLSGMGMGTIVNGPLVYIENFSGTEDEVDKLMDQIALRLRLDSR